MGLQPTVIIGKSDICSLFVPKIQQTTAADGALVDSSRNFDPALYSSTTTVPPLRSAKLEGAALTPTHISLEVSIALHAYCYYCRREGSVNGDNSSTDPCAAAWYH